MLHGFAVAGEKMLLQAVHSKIKRNIQKEGRRLGNEIAVERE
ncbi:hypothetical protein [Sinanaerobacter chloroacetimidivorans]|jgi:hypothetical protein|nr:hypothetical protein [Sinanaerobacter chloroacetimidivorans]